MTRSAVLTLRSSGGSTEAEFVPIANMVGSSLRYRGAEYLHPRKGVAAYANDGKTMGIPLLHPWANRLKGFDYRVAGKHVALSDAEGLFPRDPAGLPIHGAFPGLLHWEVEQSASERLAARLSWTSPELLRLFPFAHELTVEASVAAGELTIATTLLATGEESVPVSFGYHPYMRVPGVPRTEWQITLGASKRLLLDESMIPTGEREPIAQRRFRLADENLDAGLAALAVPPRFDAAAGGQVVSVEFLEGYSYAQVYAPAGQDFVCFEPMTAPTNALISGEGLHLVSPGDRYRAAFRISISSSDEFSSSTRS